MTALISRPALKRLQTLYSQFERRSIDASSTAAELRRDRLGWAAQCCQREVKSFNELTPAEGKLLIDALQGSFAQPQSVPSRRQRITKRDAQKQGTEGRRDQIHPDTTMLDGTEPVFHFIQRELTTLGWDQQRLGAFLRSPHGPNDGRDTIRTLGDANRIHFALKRMAVRAATSTLKGVAA